MNHRYIIRDLRKRFLAGELDAKQIERLSRIGFPFFPERGKPVICLESGQKYESISVAARAHEVEVNKMKCAIKMGYQIGGRHFYRADMPKPPTDFFKPYYGRHDQIVCVETGRCFDTLKDAAIFAGVKSGHSIRLAINSGGTAGRYHWRFRSVAEQEIDFKKTMLRGANIRCVETGETFGSLADAARNLDCDPSLIRGAIMRKGTCRCFHWSYVDGEDTDKTDCILPDPRLIQVRCVETGKVFPSIKAAASEAGVRSSNISAVIAGRQKTAGGYHWEKVNNRREKP